MEVDFEEQLGRPEFIIQATLESWRFLGSSMTPMFVHADQGQDQLETVLVLVDPEGTLPISFRGLFIGMYFATFIYFFNYINDI
jgi:hypothetical protein